MIFEFILNDTQYISSESLIMVLGIYLVINIKLKMEPINRDAEKLLVAIRDQTEGIPNHMVFVIDIVSVRFGGQFTPEIKRQLQRFEFLQMLTLNDCGIKSLKNFPTLPRLIRLDMVFNQITGEDLQYITGSRHIQTLMLGANKVEKLEHLDCLKRMHQILQLDLINNPVCRLPGYRESVYSKFKTLLVLDTLDKSGKDAYSNVLMMEAVARIPDNLFDRAPIPVVHHVPAPAPVVAREQRRNLHQALARTGSLQSMDGKIGKKVATKKKDIVPRMNRMNAKGKAKMIANPGGKLSSSSKAGLVFPVARIRRHLKQTIPGVRVGKNSGVYMGAILQYLSAQLLQVAGNEAKRQKKARITPVMIRDCLKHDEQLNDLLKNVTMNII